MSFLMFLFSVSLGVFVSVTAGIILQFFWYERNCGLLSDASSRRATAIRYELDDAPPLRSDLFW
jgi:hypothetical protein